MHKIEKYEAHVRTLFEELARVNTELARVNTDPAILNPS